MVAVGHSTRSRPQQQVLTVNPWHWGRCNPNSSQGANYALQHPHRSNQPCSHGTLLVFETVYSLCVQHYSNFSSVLGTHICASNTYCEHVILFWCGCHRFGGYLHLVPSQQCI